MAEWESVPGGWGSPKSLGVPGGESLEAGSPQKVWGSLRGPICAPQDFTRCVIGAVLFLITSLIVIVGHRNGAGIAGGVRGGIWGAGLWDL